MRSAPRTCSSKGKSSSPECRHRVSTCQRPEEREPAAFSDGNNCPRYRLGLRERGALVEMSLPGTFRTSQLHSAMSAIRGEAENICSYGAFLVLTLAV